MSEDIGATMMHSRFYRLGAFVYRRRLWVVLAWVVIFLAAGGPLSKFQDRLSQGGFEVPGSQSDQVARITERDFKGQFEITDLLVMRSPTLRATDPAFRQTFAKVREALLKAPGVAAVADPYGSPERSISKDGHVLSAIVGITDDQNKALQNNEKVEQAVEGASKGSSIDAYLTGAPPFYAAFEHTTVSDLERAEKIALPITLIILVVAFGSIVAAGVPLILALVGLAVSFGLISVIAAQTTVSSFAQNTASMVGIGVGIDYSLFVLTRFREHLKGGRAVSQAISEAMATSGKAVFVSALTVVVALAGTQMVNIAAFKSMGFSAMIAVAIAGLAALTLLPAVLGLLGRRINKWPVGRKRAEERGTALWHRWATGVMGRPWTALFACLLILGVLAAPVVGMKMGSSGPSILPPDAGPRVAAEITADAFGEGQVAPTQVLIEFERGVLDAGFPLVWSIAQAAVHDPEVTRVDSIATLVPVSPTDTQTRAMEIQKRAMNSPEAQPLVNQLVSTDNKKTLLLLVTKHGPQSDETDAMVERLRTLFAGVRPSPPGWVSVEGARVLVGGDAGLNTDILNEMSGKLIPVVGIVMLLSFLLLMLAFRSILLPLKAILMNTASVLATYGVMVFVFQNGHFEGLLNFQAAGIIDAFLPLFMFCILFGLSMDYEVFMLSRIREEYLRTGDNTEAVGWGLEHTARIITSAALIMVTVFGAFAFASLVPIKAMGFGLATAVLLDATIVRVVLVPATMRLMGAWNWWMPRRLDRILPHIGLEEDTSSLEVEREAAPVG